MKVNLWRYSLMKVANSFVYKMDDHSHGVHESQRVQILPCKYPRFTRFMTSLAVRLETSSTTQGREEKRLREVENERSRGGGTRKNINKSGRQCFAV